MLSSVTTNTTEFKSINAGYNSVFQVDRLSLGLTVPIAAYPNGPVPDMNRHRERVQLVEALGFTAVWLRDVPFNVPTFGDAGQTYDPFVYLGYLAANTKTIALGVASIILPLRHPAHVTKSAASVDMLSNGRLILGIASGDRPEEYPALNLPYENRSKRFRESFEYIRDVSGDYPEFENSYGSLNGHIDMLPKSVTGKLPLIITGASQQSPEWLAENGDGWMTYPRDITTQSKIINSWRTNIKNAGLDNKPAMQSLYIDLVEDPSAAPQPIHLGFRSGVNALRDYLKSLEDIGINHVALNVRFNQIDIETTLKRLADSILSDFT